MGKREGVVRLTQGVVRMLTPHELRRGYVYVSQDKAIVELLDLKDFTLVLGLKAFENRKIDVSGRVHVPPSQLAGYADKPIQIKVRSHNVLAITSVG